MLKEAIYHIFVAEVWYSDVGMMPLRLLPRISPTTPTLMSGLSDTGMAIAFFVLWAVVALLLLVGWQTRLMSILNLILLVSVVNRNQLVVTGADGVMQALAFWSIFLPLGRYYALDVRRRLAEPRPITYAFPVRMLQLQIALIYILTTIFKLQGQTWISGDALYMAMQVKMHTFPLADWMLINVPPSILRVLTYIALLIEGGFSILVFAPVFQPYLRRAGLIAGICLHVGIGIVMNVPNFPLVMIISYLTLLDSERMDWIDQRLHSVKLLTRIFSGRASAVTQEMPKGCLGLLTAISRGMLNGAYRGLVAGALAAVMLFVIWGNLLANDRLSLQLQTPAMPTVVEANLRVLGLWQSWALFAPDPLSYEGWFGVNGVFPNGETYDLRNKNGRPHWYLGPEARWGKLEENLMTKDKDDPIFIAWVAYTCHKYQSLGISGVQLALYSRATSAPDQPFLPYQAVVMRGSDCQ